MISNNDPHMTQPEIHKWSLSCFKVMVKDQRRTNLCTPPFFSLANLETNYEK